MRKGVALAVVGLGALAAHRYAAVRAKLAGVDPQLMSPGILALSVPMTTRTLPFVRMGYRIGSSPGPAVTMSTRFVGDDDIRVLVFSPAEPAEPRPAVLYLHGGGMCAGTPQIEAALAGQLVRELGAVAVSTDYRLAPENPFPAALDDCMATLSWMIENADEIGIDPGRIAVHGVSAGGGLTAAVAQRAHDEGIPIRAQVMSYPMLDDRTALRDDHAGRGELAWSPSSNKWAWTAYLGREPRMDDAPEYAAPSRREDATGLAPAWIGVGELDLFHPESVAYAQRLESAGVPCELVTVPGMYHTADHLAPKARPMQDFHASMVDFLRRYLVTAP